MPETTEKRRNLQNMRWGLRNLNEKHALKELYPFVGGMEYSHQNYLMMEVLVTSQKGRLKVEVNETEDGQLILKASRAQLIVDFKIVSVFTPTLGLSGIYLYITIIRHSYLKDWEGI